MFSSRSQIEESSRLIGVIADEETCAGFLLAGIGECNPEGRINFMPVKHDTTIKDIDKFFHHLYNRKDIGIILITNDIAKRISKTMDDIVGTKFLPVVLTIPSKNQ